MNAFPIAQFIALFRVNPPDDSGGGKGGACDVLCAFPSVAGATLEKIAVLSPPATALLESDVFGGQSALTSVLGLFARANLATQLRQCGNSVPTSQSYHRRDAPLNDVSSGDGVSAESHISRPSTTDGPISKGMSVDLLSPDGLFLQVPTEGYIRLCQSMATHHSGDTKSGTDSEAKCHVFPDIVYYNSISHRGAEASSNAYHLPDEGYWYGYASMLQHKASARSDGPGRGSFLVCIISTSPLFNLLHDITFEMVAHLGHILLVHNSTGLSQQRKSLEEALAEGLEPFRGLTTVHPSPRLGESISLALFRGAVTFYRPVDLVYPFVDCPLHSLLLSFSHDAIRVLQSLLWKEERIIFLGATPQHAAACAVSAPAILAPACWCAPLISYLPPAASVVTGLLDLLLAGTSTHARRHHGGAEPPQGPRNGLMPSGFIVGTTPEIVPHLLLRLSAVAATYGVASSAARVWIADARSGNVGVASVDPLCLRSVTVASDGAVCITPVGGKTLDSGSATRVAPCVTLSLVPSSEKLKAAMRGAITSRQRLAFRMAMEALASRQSVRGANIDNAQLLSDRTEGHSDDEFSDSRAGVSSEKHSACRQATSTDEVAAISGDGWRCASSVSLKLLEVHAALLEYNSQRIFGSYRKGMHWGQGGATGYAQPGSTFCGTVARQGLDLTRFLIGTLDNSSVLADDIGRTHLFQQMERALLCMESLGLSRVLMGSFLEHRRERVGSTKERHYYLNHPRMVGLMSLFLYRAQRRFPDLFADVPTYDVATHTHTVLLGGASRVERLARVAVDILAGREMGVAASCGGKESKTGMRKLFTKATKAVLSLGGATPRVVYVPDFVQASNSLGLCEVKYMPHPGLRSPTGLTAAMTDDSVTPLLVRMQRAALMDEYELPAAHGIEEALESPIQPMLSPRLQAEMGLCLPCRRLPLDVVHQFAAYHPLLSPLRGPNAYTSLNAVTHLGYSGDERTDIGNAAAARALDRCCISLFQLCPFYSRTCDNAGKRPSAGSHLALRPHSPAKKPSALDICASDTFLSKQSSQPSVGSACVPVNKSDSLALPQVGQDAVIEDLFDLRPLQEVQVVPHNEQQAPTVVHDRENALGNALQVPYTLSVPPAPLDSMQGVSGGHPMHLFTPTPNPVSVGALSEIPPIRSPQPPILDSLGSEMGVFSNWGVFTSGVPDDYPPLPSLPKSDATANPSLWGGGIDGSRCRF